MPCFLSPLSGNSVAAWLSSIFILTFILSLSFSLFPSLSPFFFLSLSSFSPPPLPLPLSLFFPLLSLPFSALPLALHPYLPPMSYLPVGLDWVHSSSHFFFFHKQDSAWKHLVLVFTSLPLLLQLSLSAADLRY